LIKQSSLKAQALVMQPSALSFTLIAPDRGSLDQFTATLVAQGLTAKLEQVTGNEQGQFSGQVTVNVVDNSSVGNKG
jgi:general secretion pathway protein L